MAYGQHSVVITAMQGVTLSGAAVKGNALFPTAGRTCPILSSCGSAAISWRASSATPIGGWPAERLTALIGLYGYSSYAPSKFAVRGLAEALRSELAPDGIGVSVVYPPDTDTPGYREELRHRSALSSRLAASGGLMSADAVAAAILHGIAQRRFVIAPGRRTAALAVLHSLVGPLLHRFWFDPLIARQHCPRRPVSRKHHAQGRA